MQQALQGQDGGLLPVLGPVLPVGLLVAGAPELPGPAGAEVQGGEVGELQRGHRAAAVRRTVDAPVVDADEVAVGGQAHIALQGVRPVLARLPVCGQRVLGRLLGGTAVGDDLDPVLSCVGHRVMVPPRAGRRAIGGKDNVSV